MLNTSKSENPDKGKKVTKFVKLDKMNVTCVVLCILGLSLLGCNTLIDHITPSPIDPIVTEYLDVNVPSFWGFTSLYNTRHLDLRINIAHKTRTLAAIREIEDEKIRHSFAKSYNDAAISEGQTIQDIVVGSEGNLFSIAGLLATAAPGLLIGRSMKRKQDYSPEEVKKLADGVQKRTEERVRAEIAAEQATAKKETVVS